VAAAAATAERRAAAPALLDAQQRQAAAADARTLAARAQVRRGPRGTPGCGTYSHNRRSTQLAKQQGLRRAAASPVRLLRGGPAALAGAGRGCCRGIAAWCGCMCGEEQLRPVSHPGDTLSSRGRAGLPCRCARTMTAHVEM